MVPLRLLCCLQLLSLVRPMTQGLPFKYIQCHTMSIPRPECAFCQPNDPRPECGCVPDGPCACQPNDQRSACTCSPGDTRPHCPPPRPCEAGDLRPECVCLPGDLRSHCQEVCRQVPRVKLVQRKRRVCNNVPRIAEKIVTEDECRDVKKEVCRDTTRTE